MIAALLRAALPFLSLAGLYVIAREAFLRWEARRVWKQYARAARVRHNRYIATDSRHKRPKL